MKLWSLRNIEMCESDTVQYLRDLIQEKEFLKKIEGHNIIKSLLEQGKNSHVFVMNGDELNQHFWKENLFTNFLSVREAFKGKGDAWCMIWITIKLWKRGEGQWEKKPYISTSYIICIYYHVICPYFVSLVKMMRDQGTK